MVKKYFLYVAFFFLSKALFAQESQLKPISHISVSEGLSDYSVTCLLEDSRGYIWIGTFNGLNRYDGYDIKKYRNTTNKKILVSNRIRSLWEDANGLIWIGTDNGITIYDYVLDRFTPLYSNQLKNKLDKGPGVLKIVENDSKGLLYAMTWQEGVLVFNSSQRLLDKHSIPSELSNTPILLNDLVLLDVNNLLISSNIGMLHFNTVTKKYKLLPDVTFENAKALQVFDNDKLLVTLETGVAIYSFKILEEGFFYTNLYKGFQNTRFNVATIDKQGNLWLGKRYTGLSFIDNVFKLILEKNVVHSQFKIETEHSNITSILITENKGAWIGSFDKGVYKLKSRKTPFKQFSNEDVLSNDINAYRILNISKIDDQRAYVITRNGRVDLINIATGKKEKLPISFRRISNSNVVDILVDSKDNTWVWYRNKKLYKVHNKSKKVELIKCEDLADLISFRSIEEDQFGDIWIHSVNSIFRLKFENDKFSNAELLSNNPFFIKDKLYYMRDFYFDPIYNYLWLGTIHDGLYRIELKKDVPLDQLPIIQCIADVNDVESLPYNYVSAIKRGPNNVLWVGTAGGGISKVNEDNDKLTFKSYTETEGLSDNNVQDLFVDKKNNIWIPTNFGLNKFNPKEESFAKFYKEDGLPFEEFRDINTLFDNGTLLLNGYRGFFYFKYEELELYKPLPQLSFTKLKVLNHEIKPKDTINGSVVLNSNLDYTNELVLEHDQNIISIDVVSLHFSNPSKYYIKYQLYPTNAEWIKVPSSQKTINFNSLPPGEYILKCKASNSLNDWTDAKELKIKILQPWWNTTIARLLYVLLIVVVVFGVVNYRLQYIRLEHDLELEQFEKDKVNEISAAKLRYFSDISHEIKTPLTLISGPVSILSEKFRKQTDIYGHLEMIQRQTRKIIQLVNQVHDFQKSDANALKLNKSHFYFKDLIDEVSKDFELHVINHQKKLEIQKPEHAIYVFADYDKIEKVLTNLLSNSFKFTEPDDTVTIRYYQEGNKLCVAIEDTGKGIEPEDLPHVFDRFYHSRKKNSFGVGGSGIGLAFSKRLVEMHYGNIVAESEFEKGTIISFQLPIVIEGYSEVQIEKEKEVLATEREYNSVKFVPDQKQLENIDVDESISGASIFLAEDNDDMRMFISNALSGYFKVSTFRNGKLCLDALATEWPDLIISDVLMPELNGFELCRRVKSDINTSHIPIVLLTACADVDEQVKGLMDGADSYITKPFEMKLLISKLESILQGRKLLRERFEVNLPLTRKKDEIVNVDLAFLEKLYSLMDDNIDNPDVDINSFAKELFLSRTHFFQKVKALTDQTPYNLLKTYRLKKAATMLVQQKMSVNEVFLSTGFKNRPHFNKAFKEFYSVSPSVYASKGGVI
ncbi:hybrid sensor histidine kinase/response regulator transcription factor [Flavicella marina]|uniref:hybrid sensor histidine kinase/response regulator transcription factor n=1 Tax=Flavicella marina TaxID=1475951 RepID=UPI001263FC80|nr:ATP-binding protein [Flavicella marina]